MEPYIGPEAILGRAAAAVVSQRRGIPPTLGVGRNLDSSTKVIYPRLRVENSICSVTFLFGENYGLSI